MSPRNLDVILKHGLESWRQQRLQAIAERMIDVTENYWAASEGLGIAHRNPGEVERDVIEYLWEKLNESATQLQQLEDTHQVLFEMDLAHLVITFKRERKDVAA